MEKSHTNEVYVLDRNGTLRWGGSSRQAARAEGQHVVALLGCSPDQWTSATAAAAAAGHAVLAPPGNDTHGAWQLIDLGMATGWLLQWSPASGSPQALANRMWQLERVRAAVNEHALVVITNADGEITYANESFCRLSGFECSELLGQSHRIVNSGHHPREFFADLWRTIRSGRTWRGEICNRRKHGPLFWLATSIIPICNRDGQPAEYIALCTDVTHRKEAEQEKRAQATRSEETQRRENVALMATGIAHDFNNLLTGILGAVELAAECPTGPHGDYLEQIRNASLRASEMCRILLDHAGKTRRPAQPLDLTELVNSSKPFLRASARSRATLRFDSIAATPEIVVAEAARLRQVLLNLVVNACDALGGRPGEIRISTGVSELDRAALGNGAVAATDVAPGRFCFLAVSDDGCGITPENRRKLFDPFFTTKASGRGVGLATVATIVRESHAVLFVDSEPGRGSTFRLCLPEQRATVEEPAHPPTVGNWRGHGRLLLADPDELARNVTASMLKHLGFQVDAASDTGAALALLNGVPASAYRLAIVDSSLPRRQFPELAQELARRTPDLPILRLSGEVDPDELLKTRRDPRLLRKPFLIGQLAEALQGLLEHEAGDRALLPAEPALPEPIELVCDRPLQPHEDVMLELHGVMNLLNVLSGECQMLRAAVPGVRPVSIDFEEETEALRERGWDHGRLAKRLRRIEAEIFNYLETLPRDVPAVTELPQAQESIDSIRSATCLLLEHHLELAARMTTPNAWHAVPVARIFRNFHQLLETVALVSHGKFRITTRPAQKGPLDYLVTLDIAPARGGKQIRLPAALIESARDLMMNARKYTPPGGHIWVRLHETDTEVELSVTDTGIGVPAEEIPLIGRFGYRATNVRQRPTRGGGFGLTKALIVARRFGGKLSVASRVGSGTRVVLTVPKPRKASVTETARNETPVHH